MKEILENLEKIRKALGQVNVSFELLEHKRGSVNIRVGWNDGSNYRVEQNYTPEGIKSVMDDSLIIDKFIQWARRMREEQDEDK